MDANGTLFHLLLGRDDWANCLDSELHPLHESWSNSNERETVNRSGIDWDPERNELTLQKRVFQFTNPARSKPPSLKDRRGAARDRFGNWYWIDETRQKIQVNSSGTQATTDFWSNTHDNCVHSTAPADFHSPDVSQSTHTMTLSGLTVTAEHYLVAGVLEPAGLLIFDLYGGGALQLLWPSTVRFAPFDMAAAKDGGLFVLDRDNQRYWPLDRHFNVVGAEPAAGNDNSEVDFHPEDGATRPASRGARHVVGITDDAACALHTRDAIAIEALPDNTVLILEGDPDVTSPPAGTFSLIHRYRLREQLGEPASTKTMLERIEDMGENFSLIGYDFAFVADDSNVGHLYIVERNGNQSYAFLLKIDGEQLVLEAIADYLPMRLFAGRALVAAGPIVYYDFEHQWVPLVAQRRPRYVPEATIFTPLADEDRDIAADETKPRGAFDGRDPDCVWHRLMLDACIPPEAEVMVWSRAANDQRELALAEWQPEPKPYLRGKGSELPFAPRPSKEKEIKGQGAWELLFQNARGRFLQVQLILIGNGRTTPRLRALRAYYPRFSYLNHYLPAVYREDNDSASFLDRFLANIEGTYTTIEDRIAAAQILFDMRATPEEFLDWLASWFGVALDPSWEPERKRVFIKHAMELFNRRGTIKGLEMALRIALDACVHESQFTDERGLPRDTPTGIRIVEKFRTRFAASVAFGDPTDYDAVPSGLRSTRWLAAEISPSAGRATFLPPAEFEELYGVPPCPECNKQSMVGPTPAGQLRLTEGTAAITNDRGRWQAFLKSRYADNINAFNAAYTPRGEPRRNEFSDVPLPRDLPPQGAPLNDWMGWIEISTGQARERKLWQDFLARRYRLIATLNRTYETRWSNFETVSLPNATPTRNLAARDWQLFVEVVLAMHRRAHRFTVLLPVPTATHFDRVVLDDRRARAEQVINLQKPAHTAFEVKFYWAAFRLGEARLGTDTIADRGSRMLSLTQPMILDRTYISQGYLASGNSPESLDRQVIGHASVPVSCN